MLSLIHILFRQGVVCGVVGLVILLATVAVWRKMEGKDPIKINAKTVGSVLVGVLGALLFGVGMCLSMVFGKMVLGIGIGLVGIVVLLLSLIHISLGMVLARYCALAGAIRTQDAGQQYGYYRRSGMILIAASLLLSLIHI